MASNNISQYSVQRFYDERVHVRLLSINSLNSKGLALDLMAGDGSMSNLYRPIFSKVITVDSDKRAPVDYNMKAEDFLKAFLPTIGKTDLVDIDAYGNPNSIIEDFFKYAPEGSPPFALVYGDGSGLAMKRNPRIYWAKKYLYEYPPLPVHRYLTAMSEHFIQAISKSRGWVAEPLYLKLMPRKNYLIGAFMIKEDQ